MRGFSRRGRHGLRWIYEDSRLWEGSSGKIHGCMWFFYIYRWICTRAAMLIRMEHTRSLQRGEPRLGKCNRLSLWRQPQSAQTYLKGWTTCINKKGCHFEDSTRQHAQLKMSTPQPHHGIFFLYHAWDRWSLLEHKGIYSRTTLDSL